MEAEAQREMTRGSQDREQEPPANSPMQLSQAPPRTKWSKGRGFLGNQTGTFGFGCSSGSDLALWDLREAAFISSLLGEEAPSRHSDVLDLKPMHNPRQGSVSPQSEASKPRTSLLPPTGCPPDKSLRMHVWEGTHPSPYMLVHTYAHMHTHVHVCAMVQM